MNTFFCHNVKHFGETLINNVNQMFISFADSNKINLLPTQQQHNVSNINISNTQSHHVAVTKSTSSESHENIENLHNSKTLRLTQESKDLNHLHHQQQQQQEQIENESTTTVSVSEAPSNFLELTTEKLSLTNKSLSNSSTNVTTNENASTSHTAPQPTTPSDSSQISNSSVNVHHAKISKQRGNSNSLVKVPSVSGGGVRVSGQKIEMPQLNNYFDHSAYLKKHEHGFR